MLLAMRLTSFNMKADLAQFVQEKETHPHVTLTSDSPRPLLMFRAVTSPLLDVCRSYQEFSRVLKKDGVVVVTLWEGHEGSVFQLMRNVLETLIPGKRGWFLPSN